MPQSPLRREELAKSGAKEVPYLSTGETSETGDRMQSLQRGLAALKAAGLEVAEPSQGLYPHACDLRAQHHLRRSAVSECSAYFPCRNSNLLHKIAVMQGERQWSGLSQAIDCMIVRAFVYYNT